MKKTNIELEFSKSSKSKGKDEDLQRTLKWQMQRLGCWTASAFKNLMTSSQAGSKISWSENHRIFLFGKTALKYIYSNGMERKTGRYVDTGDGTLKMKYGTVVEPLIAKLTKQQLKKENIKGKIKAVGFKVFDKIPTVGVSSDSIFKHKKKVLATVEMKACTNWNTHYDRTFEKMNEKSLDFWQVQGQMKAWNVDICYYVTAEPPNDIKKYVYYDGDIMDLFEDFKKECKITIEKVDASPIHQNALIKRVLISERTLKDWKKENYKSVMLKKIHENSISYFKENESLLEDY